MPRKRQGERDRDGVSIRDEWALRGRRTGGRWLYRVWDSVAKKYRARVFADAPETDANRKTPGCAAGDAWAETQGARFYLKLDTAKGVTLREVGEKYLENRTALGRSKSQLGVIRLVLDAAVAAGIGDLMDPNVPDITQQWLSRLPAGPRGFKSKPESKPRKTKKATPRPLASPRTKNKYLSTLRAIGGKAVSRGWIRYNPFDAVDRVPESKRHRLGYAIAELRKILADDHRDDPWWQFAVLVAYTGTRSETLRSLTWDMVDWDRNRIDIPASITKSNNDIRVPIQPELRAILLENPGVGKAAILGPRIAAMTSDQANREMQAFLDRVGIDSKGRSVHAFRHTVASLLIATGQGTFLTMDALGHTSTQTSKGYAAGAADHKDQVKREGWPEGEFFLRRPPPKAIAATPAGRTESIA